MSFLLPQLGRITIVCPADETSKVPINLSCIALEKLLGFSLRSCLMKTWPNTDLFCGGSHGIPVDERLRIKRAYGRVDRTVRL